MTATARLLPVILLTAGYAFLALHLLVLERPPAAIGALGFACLCSVCLFLTPADDGPPRLGAKPGARAARGWIVTVAVSTGLLFLAIGYLILARRHPAEDAYILFRYAEHLAAGHGIVFNADGPRAEGATDFLWLLALAAGVSGGLDVAIVALVLNAAGAALLAGLLAWSVADAGHRTSRTWVALLILLPLLVVSSHVALAAYLGFSTLVYAGLVVLLFWTALRNERRSALWIPWLGLTIALFRPDGVVIGVAFTLLGIWQARRLGVGRSYLAAALGAALAGLTYFAWRVSYFGLLLPLPLYVKARAAVPLRVELDSASSQAWTALSLLLPGLESHVTWLSLRISPLPALLAILCLAWALRRSRPAELLRSAVFFLPLVAFSIVLTLGQLVQNVEFRFQAPISATLMFVLVRATAWAFDGVRDPRARVMLLAALLPIAAVPVVSGVRLTGHFLTTDRTAHDYLDSFAPILGAAFDKDDVVVLTEAGRVPYWTTAGVQDVIGLNQPDRALTPPSREDLDHLSPAVVLFHHVQTMEFSSLRPSHLPPPFVLPVPADRLEQVVRPRFRDLYWSGLTSYDDTRFPAIQAVPVILTRFLADSGNYEILAVDQEGDGSYEHVWGFRLDWPPRARVIDRLRAAGRFEFYTSYLDLKRLRAGSSPP